jgi:predicted PurR-regulated permease PerM
VEERIERPARPHPRLDAPALTPFVIGAVVVAALYLGRDLLVPLALAVILAFVLAPLVRLLRRTGIGEVAAVLLAVLLGAAAMVGVALVVVRQLAALAGGLGGFAENIRARLDRLRIADMLAAARDALRGLRDLVAGEAVRITPVPAPLADDPSPVEVAAAWLGPVLAPLATAGIVVVFALFILLYREDVRDRVIRLAGARDLPRTVGALDDAAYRLSRLFVAQLAMNTGVAIVVGAALWVAGLPGAVLFGLIAGLMRFVPFLGTPIAVIPPLLVALAADPGWGLAVAVLGLFAITEPLMGQVVEPLVFGRSAGLSPLSVVVAAAFWTFMWGGIGLLLATPLTVCLVVLGRHVPRLEFLEVMLGDRPPLHPEESFYQRALAGDADALVAQARAALGAGMPLVEWHDAVALRGLTLAEADWWRDALDPARLAVIRAQVETLLDELAETPPTSADQPAGWRAEGAVLCLGGRGRLDDLAAAVAAQGLRQEGFGALTLPGEALAGAAQDGAPDARLDPGRVRLCCLAVLQDGSSAAAVRYLLRRLARRLPGVPVVVALWHAPAGSPTLVELRRAGGGAASIATSLAEVVAFCQAAASREVAMVAAPAG